MLSEVWIEAKVERKAGVEAQFLCQRPPSALSQVIVVKVELLERGVEAQCLCKRPPSALSLVIVVKDERRARRVEAQCL